VFLILTLIRMDVEMVQSRLRGVSFPAPSSSSHDFSHSLNDNNNIADNNNSPTDSPRALHGVLPSLVAEMQQTGSRCFLFFVSFFWFFSVSSAAWSNCLR
jgi:hypothetical protein